MMKKRIIIILISIVGLLLIVTGFSIRFLSNKGSESKDNNNNIEEKDSSKGENMSVPDTKKLEKDKDGNYVNSNSKISTKHVSGDFSINDMYITLHKEYNEFATYTFTLNNNGKEDFNSFELTIGFIFKDGTKYIDAPFNVDALAAGEKIELQRTISSSIMNAVDYEITIKSNEG